MPCALAAAVLAVGAAACAREPAGEESPQDDPRPAAEGRTAIPLPAVTVRVVDGDSGEPVEGARVALAGERAVTGTAGVARVTVARTRAFAVRVSAPGYGPQEQRVDFRRRAARVVRVWRLATQWPLYGADTARTQVHRGIGLRPPYRVVWKRTVDSLLEFPAAVWEGVAYVSTMRGWLRAISMEDGRLLWKRRVGSLSASSPGLDPKRRLLVVTTMSPGHVNLVSMDTGKIRGRFYTGRAEPSPLVTRGVAYFGAANGRVYALDLDRRRPRWVLDLGGKITGSPALVGNRLYIGSYSGQVAAVDARTGRRVWTRSLGGRVYGTIAVAAGRVFVPNVDSGMFALSARSGRVLWRVPVGSYLYSSPAVFRGRVYFGTYGGLVYAVGARSGRVLWTRSAGGGAVSAAVQVVSGLVYASSLRHRTTAWHWRTGRVAWRFPLGKYVPLSGNGERLLLHGALRIWALEEKRRR